MREVVIEEDLIRIGERFAVAFQRTLRIPDDGRVYPLPPGLGRFPILDVKSLSGPLPPGWRERGGAVIPMYRREALWLGFHAASFKPNAVKIAIGGVNAVSGGSFDEPLHADPQDYLVCPEQPWLDGIHSESGAVRQFVAMPLGLGYTVESSLRGAETEGGIQITVFEPVAGRFPDRPPPPGLGLKSRRPAMGLGAGGLMKQKIYPDPYGIGTWDQSDFGRVRVHILDSEAYAALTGREPPPTPIDAQTYSDHGLPWFELYDQDRSDVPRSERLAGARTIAETDAERGEAVPADPAFEPEFATLRSNRSPRESSAGPPAIGHPPGRE